jgi:hypothetical protein
LGGGRKRQQCGKKKRSGYQLMGVLIERWNSFGSDLRYSPKAAIFL